MVQAVLEGYNCSVLAYGQTGSGKTHTILGEGAGDREVTGDGDMPQHSAAVSNTNHRD